jgi:hypothetical protein
MPRSPARCEKRSISHRLKRDPRPKQVATVFHARKGCVESTRMKPTLLRRVVKSAHGPRNLIVALLFATWLWCTAFSLMYITHNVSAMEAAKRPLIGIDDFAYSHIDHPSAEISFNHTRMTAGLSQSQLTWARIEGYGVLVSVVLFVSVILVTGGSTWDSHRKPRGSSGRPNTGAW